jgi:hypothetical protein
MRTKITIAFETRIRGRIASLDGAVTVLDNRHAVVSRDETLGHDVSSIGDRVRHLLNVLPYRDAALEASHAIVVEERAVVMNDSERTWL